MAATICILKHRLNKSGGLEKSTYAIAHGFAKKGCRVVILTSDNPDPFLLKLPQISFEKIELKKRLGFLRIKEFDQKAQKFLSSSSFDLVFGMDRNTSQTHLRLGNGIHKIFLKRRAPVESFFKRLSFFINPLHRLLLSYEKKSLESPLLKCLFTNSHMVKQELLDNFSLQESKIHVLHNGVEWRAMEKDFQNWVERKPKIAKELGLNPLDYHFLFIGHGFKRKGLDLLLLALALLENKSFHLSIVGNDKNLKSLKEQAKRLGLCSRVTFFQERSDVRKFYQLCDALIVPSLYDPFANVTVEALAMGLYVLSSTFNGGAEVLQDFSGSVIKNIFDPECFAKTLIHACEHQKKTWAKSIKVRDSVKHLDFSAQTATLVDISLKHL